MEAAAVNQPAAIVALLQAGADMKLVNEAGETAADIAKRLGHEDAVKALGQQEEERLAAFQRRLERLKAGARKVQSPRL